MKMDKKIYMLAFVNLCLAIFSARADAGSDVSISGIDRIIAASSIPADPGVTLIVGVGLIAIRVLIATKSRRREKNLPIPNAMNNAVNEPRASSST